MSHTRSPFPTLIVGAGPAGLRCAEHLARRGIAVRVIGGEPGLPYNRVALSQYLSGEYDEQALVTHDEDRLRELGIAFTTGTMVKSIDAEAKSITLADGAKLPYADLVLALGSRAFRLPLPGAELPGVLMYRTLHEVRTMLDVASRGGRAIVIGGGLLGLEAAVGLSKRGMQVTVLHAVDRLMERQLDHAAAGLLAQRLRGQGIAVELAAGSVAITGETHATGILLKDGRTLPAELIVMAVGIRPEVELARGAGLLVERGIVVNNVMRTSDPHIYAIGECAQHKGETCGLVAPAFAQAEVAASNIAGNFINYIPVADTAHVEDRRRRACGRAGDIAATDVESLVYDDPDLGEYRKFLLREGRLVAAVLYGETGDAAWYKSLLGADVRALRGVLAVRPGLCTDARGSRMNDEAFSDEQQNYLKGFMSGVEAKALRPRPADASPGGAASAPAVDPNDLQRAGAGSRIIAVRRQAGAAGGGEAEEASARPVRRDRGDGGGRQVRQGHRRLPDPVSRAVLCRANAGCVYVPAAHSRRHPRHASVPGRGRYRR